MYQQLAAGIHTNLSLDETIKLALLAQQVPLENIQREIIGKEQVIFGFSPDNLSILIPLPDKIQLLRDKVFATSSSLGPETEGSSQQQMQAERARLAVLNGSSATDLGERTANFLRDQGVNITQVSAADQNYAATTIIDHSGSPYLLKYLLETLKISPTRAFK